MIEREVVPPPPEYEYRVLDKFGEEFERYRDEDAAEFHAERQQERYPEFGPHRVQRRPVGAWEDA